MNRRSVLIMSAACAVLAPVGTALATSKRVPTQTFEYKGTVTAVDVAVGKIAMNVEGGNRIALKSLIGQPAAETFTVGPATQYIGWVAGVPGVYNISLVQPGNKVVVKVKAPRNSALSTILAAPAYRVVRVIQPLPRTGRAYAFIGNCKSVSANTVTMDVTGGNWRALYKMLGQPITQTFAYDPNATPFVSWSRGYPTAFPAAQAAQYCAQTGGNMKVTVYSPKGSTLQQITATSAARVAFFSRPTGPGA